MMADEKWMMRCIELAQLGAGNVSPNPMVGSVLVHEEKIIGEGWHRKYGGPHAEVNAIAQVYDTELISQSTLYVNLEPCAHEGKTPPCANMIISQKIPKVVIGMADPNPLVAGKGIELLRQAGVEVIVGVLNKECLDLNKRFIQYFTKQKPFVILKWAQTRNGYLAPDAAKMSPEQFEKERHITGFWVQKLVHKWRTQEDAILVGTQTALLDNPALNARAWIGRDPIRIVLDQHLRLPSHLKIFDGSQTTILVNGSREEKIDNLYYLKLDFSRNNWFEDLLFRLKDFHIQSLVVEGGAMLLNEIIASNEWNEAIVFYSPKIIEAGIPAPFIRGKCLQLEELNGIQMTQYLNT